MLNPLEFFFNAPLYLEVEITTANEAEFLTLMTKTKFINGYSIALKENTTYQVHVSPETASFQSSEVEDFAGVSRITLNNVREQEQIVYYCLLREARTPGSELGLYSVKHFFQKIGQFPSLADLQVSQFKQFGNKVIDKSHLKEITKAIGLVSHGIGIGSYVYLRRIFEILIEEAHQSASTLPEWNEGAYIASRMADKIELLSDFLPEFLVSNKPLYSILSKGIHELAEEECLKYFPAVLTAIEFILEERLEKINKQKRIEEAKKQIQLINGEINSETASKIKDALKFKPALDNKKPSQ